MAGVTSVVIDGTTYLVDDINAVDFSDDQGLSEQQQEQGRSNIGAAAETALAGLESTVDELSDDVDGLTEQLVDKADVIVDTASGAIASFPDGAAVAAKDITIGIEPVQSGSGDPSPTNVRPISGWTGANVTRTGFNVWDEEWEVGGYKGSDGTPDYSATSWIMSKPNKPITVKEGVPYYLKKYGYWMYYDENDNYLHYTTGTNKTIPSNVKYLRFCIPNYFTNGITTYNHDICINISDPARNGTYEPGNVVTYPISWQSEAGTVYGGTLDVTTGLLTVTHGKVVLDGSFSPVWVSSSGGAAQYLSNNLPDGNLKQISSGSSMYILLSDKLYTKDGDNSHPWRCALYSESNTRIFINFPSEIANTIAAWNAYLAQNPITIIYPYENPVAYNLTPAEVTLLLGDNNVWADTGDSTVTYRADTKLYIQKINAPTDDDMIADAQIASGRYFIVGGNLYRSTTTIPAGDAINPGSNCILTNLADALNALNT